MATNTKTLVIGAGPAGLTAAYELSKLGHQVEVFEADSIVGGISRTVKYKGNRFDIGGHRFFTKVEPVNELWHEILGDEFLTRPRLSRIFYNDKFFDYPLKPMNALMGLGPVEAVRIGLSYMHAALFPSQDERNFEQWVSNRFGKRLFEIFFKTYTEKVWGIPCSEIGADWAAQRIKNLNLTTAVKNALFSTRGHNGEVITTLIDQFQYPRYGPGQMWEACHRKLESSGVAVHLGTRIEQLVLIDGKIGAAIVRGPGGDTQEIQADYFIASMPLRDLVLGITPAAPPVVVESAKNLRYRDFLTVGLICNKEELFPDNWIYIHSGKVKMGRIQNFKNWSPYMVADPSKTSLGLEYFVQENDELWSASDDYLVELGTRESEILGLLNADDVEDGCVIRMPKAYPVYDSLFNQSLATLRTWLDGIPNLQSVGRNGQHRYNNQDHSMLTALYAAQNIDGANYDIWNVNVDQSYHEVVEKGEQGITPLKSDRLIPEPTPTVNIEALIESAFAQYDARALGTAIGIVCGVGLFLATSILLIKGGTNIGQNLAVFANFFIGYKVTWMGAIIGLVQASVGGFIFGYVLAKLINVAVRFNERILIRKIELNRLMVLDEQD